MFEAVESDKIVDIVYHLMFQETEQKIEKISVRWMNGNTSVLHPLPDDPYVIEGTRSWLRSRIDKVSFFHWEDTKNKRTYILVQQDGEWDILSSYGITVDDLFERVTQ